jgi:hypothetical protein
MVGVGKVTQHVQGKSNARTDSACCRRRCTDESKEVAPALEA